MSEMSRLGSSTLLFLLVARALGPSNYGTYIAITAIVALLSAFSNLGGPVLMVQRVRRDGRDAGAAFQTSIRMILIGSVVATGVAILVAHLVVPSGSAVAVSLFAIAEYMWVGIIQLVAYSGMALGNVRFYSMTIGALSLARIAAALLFWVTGSSSVVIWAVLLCGFMFAAAIGASITVERRFALRPRPGGINRQDVTAGLPYSAIVATFSAQDGLDTPILVHYGWTADAGYYAAAYRMATLAFLPIQALVVASFNRSFSEGRLGIRGSLTLARRLIGPGIIYSVAVAVLLTIFAPIFRPLLGNQFSGAVEILRWLAFLPLVRTMQYFPANALTGAGYNVYRFACLLVTLTIAVVAYIALIPDHSWRGAVVATAIAESIYAVLLWIIAYSLLRRESSAVGLDSAKAAAG